ncbi:MAG: hypothetical protein M8357_09885 [Desulfobulbaceae bacterium]|nr:hypothetical protein [Desulfobulbaceae bacterium]
MKRIKIVELEMGAKKTPHPHQVINGTKTVVKNIRSAATANPLPAKEL